MRRKGAIPAPTRSQWSVGVTETCERLGNFASHDEAAEFISTLPNCEDGIYFLDSPADLLEV